MIKIPAIDIIEGKVVRLTKGDFDQQKTYSDNILTLAKAYEAAGARQLHIIDLDAARGKADNRDLVYEVIKSTTLSVQLGGGIRNETVLKECFDNGVAACIIGSLAVKDKTTLISWIKKYGADRIIIGADVREEYIATDGWLETSDLHINEFVEHYKRNEARRFLCTDISLDGTLEGTSNELYKSLMNRFPDLEFIASGGVSSMEDLVALESMGMYGVVIGKALLENRVDLKSLYL